MEANKVCPKVFISYSWVVGDRVLDLSERLMANGVEVILDKWDLKPGHDKYAFMEQSVSDVSVHKVLIICDKSYAEKANKRSGGVGDETVIISPEVYQKIEQEKFIPIVFEKDENGKEYLPHFIKSRIFIDLSDNSLDSEKNFEILLRDIFNKPLFSKPAIGKRPEWLDSEKTDYSALRDVIKQLRHENNKTKIDYLINRVSNEVIELVQNLHLNQELPPDEAMLVVIDESKILRDLILDYFEIVMFSEADFSIIIPEFFENIYNEVSLSRLNNLSNDYLYEAVAFLIWELFICTVALCVKHERYTFLREILAHSYYLCDRYSIVKAMRSYRAFCAHCEKIETECKQKCDEPRLFTLQGRMLTQRERRPVFSKQALCEADLILYQLYPLVVGIKSWGVWYPISYVYASEKQEIWAKLSSIQRCRKIFALFNVSTPDELKEAINKSGENINRQGYSGSFRSLPVIIDSIPLNEIGSIN